MSADPLLDGPLDPMPDAFEATSRCSFSTSLAIWSGARYGEAMHTVGRRLACGTRTRSCRLPEQKDTVIFSRRWCLRQPGYLRVPRSRGVGYSIPLSADRLLQENKGWERMEMDAKKTVNARLLVVIIDG